jgi:PKD repeat protein
MKKTNLNATLVAVFVCLMAILASCVVTPAPYTGEGDPTLNATKTGLRLLSVAATNIQTETGTYQDGVQIKFSEPMLDSSVTEALTIYEGEYNPFFIMPNNWQRPTLISECNGRFKISNPNNFDLSFTWKIMKSVEEGQGIVKANSSAYINTSQGMKMLEIYFNQTDPNATQTWQAREVMTDTPCPIAWSLNWSNGSKGEKQNLFIPNHNFTPGKYTITLSTNARSQKRIYLSGDSDSIRLETPVRIVITIGTDGKLENTTEILYPKDPIFNPPPRDPVDPNNPLQVRAELEADAFPPLMTVAESASFDASGSTGDIAKYQWQFCDGDRLEGAIVEKVFNQNGTCSVMLTVTDENGKADSVVSDVEVMKAMPDIISSSSLHGINDTAIYDAGIPIQGLKYQWNIQDKNGETFAVAEGSKVRVTYPELGSYDVFLSVLDYRDQLNISNAGASRVSRNKTAFRKGFVSSTSQVQDAVTVSSTPLPQITSRVGARTQASTPSPEEAARDLIDRIVISEISIETRSANKPKAKLSIIDEGVTRKFGMGRVGTSSTKSFTINASNSTGFNLEYTFKICKLVFRSVCTQEIIRSTNPSLEKEFAPGDYTIQLEVKDKWQQLDTAQSYISITDSDKYHVRFSLNLDGRSPRIASKSKEQTQLENKGLEDFSTRARFKEFEAIENKTWYTTSFPFITTEESTIYRAAARWNDWSNGMKFQPQLCKQMFSFNNRIPTPANVFLWDSGFSQITFAEDLFYFTGWLVFGFDFVQDTALCDWTMMITSQGFNKFNSSSDNEQLFSE